MDEIIFLLDFWVTSLLPLNASLQRLVNEFPFHHKYFTWWFFVYFICSSLMDSSDCIKGFVLSFLLLLLTHNFTRVIYKDNICVPDCDNMEFGNIMLDFPRTRWHLFQVYYIKNGISTDSLKHMHLCSFYFVYVFISLLALLSM